MMQIREDAEAIWRAALFAAQPDTAVKKALAEAEFADGRVILVAAGKAAWQMAEAAQETLGDRIDAGIVITKYHHAKGPIGKLLIREAGHPVPDGNSYRATEEAIGLVSGLKEADTVLFLLSGGGSALFEKPLIPAEDLERVTNELLACGAAITEINTVRKRFSGVKGGRFAELCRPASVFSIVLSDILGDPLDMIASGPAYPDSSTCAEALAIADKYRLSLSEEMRALLKQETPKTLERVTTKVTGSVRELCKAAEQTARELGYEPMVLTSSLSCTARDAGVFLSNLLQHYRTSERSLAFIAGGETVVQLTGTGLGGRNQELALAAAPGIAGIKGACVFSLGSDGTDGPTDAAGGIVFSDTEARLRAEGLDTYRVLADNDSYHALARVDGLIMTGPTGTNVNDLSVALLKR